MRTVAVDTSTSFGTLAALDGNEVLAERCARIRARHGELLLPLLETLLKDAGWAPEDVELLVVGLGPGSFTGTRVGVATVKGLALGWDCPVVGVPTLEALARQSGRGAINVAVDGGRGMVYAASYDIGDVARAKVAPQELTPAQAIEAMPSALPWVGDGFVRAEVAPEGLLPMLFSTPRAAALAFEALAKIEALGLEAAKSDIDSLEPLYIRPSDAKLPSK